jgi:hypothetical protein
LKVIALWRKTCPADRNDLEREAILVFAGNENSAATFSAVSSMLSTPYCCLSRELMNCHPIVVSCSDAWRANDDSACPSRKGARVIDSAPPAIISDASPALIARAAQQAVRRAGLLTLFCNRTKIRSRNR